MLGATLTALAVYLLIVGLLVATLTPALLNKMDGNWERQAQVQVFLGNQAKDTDRAALQRSLLSDPNVASVSYVSKELALARFKEQMEDGPGAVPLVSTPPLPASFEIALRDPRQVEAFVAKIEAAPLPMRLADRPDNPNESIKYGREVLARYVSLIRAVRILGLLMVVPAVICAILAAIFVRMVPPNERRRLLARAVVAALALVAASGLVLYARVDDSVVHLLR